MPKAETSACDPLRRTGRFWQPQASLKSESTVEGSPVFRQLKLEGIRVTPEGRIAPSGAQSDGVPLVLVAQIQDGECHVMTDASLPEEIRCHLCEPDLAAFKIESSLVALQTAGVAVQPGHFKTYGFPDLLDQVAVDEVVVFTRTDPGVVALGFHVFSDEIFGIEDGATLVAACVSARQDDLSAEAWVYVRPEYRRRGLARKVVVAWAGAMRAAGRFPFYSHLIDNTASASLAASLGLVPLFEEKVIERADEDRDGSA